MVKNHWGELDPGYVLDEGGFGSRDVYAPGKLVFGVSVAGKQSLWLRLRAQGTSCHGSQPIPDNANDLLMQAIERARDFRHSEEPNPLVENVHSELGAFASNKFMNAVQQNTLSITSLRSGVDTPPKVKRDTVAGGSDSRLPSPSRAERRRIRIRNESSHQ